jgi:hypothetical protein
VRAIATAVSVFLLAASLAAAQPEGQAVPSATLPAGGAVSAAASVRPSVDHERLDSLAGTFRFERTSNLPGSPPTRSSGTSENRWILNGNYLECRSTEGEGTGKSENLITYGFDLRRRVYFALLLGSRGTNYQNLEGFYDEPTRSFVLIGKDAGDGRVPGPKLRQVVRIESPQRYVVELFAVPLGGLPQKLVEIQYTRE